MQAPENQNNRLRQEQVHDPNTLGWSNSCQHEEKCLGNLNLQAIFPAEQDSNIGDLPPLDHSDSEKEFNPATIAERHRWYVSNHVAEIQEFIQKRKEATVAARAAEKEAALSKFRQRIKKDRENNPGYDEDCSSEPAKVIGEINEIDSKQYKCVQAIVDSGAGDHVGPPSILPHLPIHGTVASRNRMYYQAANGTKIPNLGCKEISGTSDLGDAINLRMQVGKGTKRILGSVMRLTSAGCRVVFDDVEGTGGFIQHKETAKFIPIHNEEDNYVMNMWIPNQNIPESTHQLTGNLRTVE